MVPTCVRHIKKALPPVSLKASAVEIQNQMNLWCTSHPLLHIGICVGVQPGDPRRYGVALVNLKVRLEVWFLLCFALFFCNFLFVLFFLIYNSDCFIVSDSMANQSSVVSVTVVTPES